MGEYVSNPDLSTEELREAVRQHLSCVHNIVGIAVVRGTHTVSRAPICENCSMVILATGKDGAYWRN